MLIVNKNEGEEILYGGKIATLRPIKANGKGYCRLGSIQQIRVGRDFKAPYLCRVLIYSRDFVNIDNLGIGDIQELGYRNKAEYLAQSYNQANPSRERVRYYFIELGELLEYATTCEISPQTFADLVSMCRYNSDLMRGVEVCRVFEGCDLSDLEEQFQALQSNIEEVCE